MMVAHGQILQREGWKGLFQGLQASLLGTAVSQGVYFYFYSLLRQFFVARHQRLTSTRSQVHTPTSIYLYAAFSSTTLPHAL